MIAALHRLALQVFGALPRGVRRRIVRTVSPSFTVGAVCVVSRADGRVLLVRQRYRHHWGLPGGLLERGEPTAVAARREVAEETGLDVELLGEPAVVVEPGPQRVDVIYRASPRAGQDLDALAPHSPEIEELRWFAPDALPQVQDETSTALVALGRLDGQRLRTHTERRAADD
ncbi:MAG TPA: NUDIX domain-containing protein [Acidimicrobiales bacterium]|nr:NUDIX domain-containing protein [Acidimicrobiales bacterium]